MAYAHFKLLDFEQALTHYEHAVALDPNQTAGLNGVGAALMTLYIQDGRERTDQRDRAIAAWRKSIQLEPDQPRIVDLLSRYSRL